MARWPRRAVVRGVVAAVVVDCGPAVLRPTRMPRYVVQATATTADVYLTKDICSLLPLRRVGGCCASTRASAASRSRQRLPACHRGGGTMSS